MGSASATACALLGLDCVVYMGEVDIARQQPNVYRMKLLGRRCSPCEQWQSHPQRCDQRSDSGLGHQRATPPITCLAPSLGPHPYPRDGARLSQSVIGQGSAANKCSSLARPSAQFTIIACVGGGSNAMGIFHAFRDDLDIESKLASKRAVKGLLVGKHAARFADPEHCPGLGVLHGTKSYVMQTADGQIMETHSISAGLDYPSVGPNMLGCVTKTAPSTPMPLMRGVSRLPNTVQSRGHHPRPRIQHAVAELLKRAPKCVPIKSSLSTSVGGEIRI